MRIMALSALILLAAGSAHAQVSPTEQYVPIGKTSAEGVRQGRLSATVTPQTSVQPQSASPAAPAPTASFTMTTGGKQRTYVIGQRTRIYVDRSQSGEPNTLGTIDDLRRGRDVEAFVPDLASRVALWLKVRP